MKDSYTAPAETRIGHVNLNVSDLDKALKFYRDLPGFKLTTFMYGDPTACLSAKEYHYHIGLNTWHSKGSVPAPQNSPGLYHTSLFLYPSRKDFAIILKRLIDEGYAISGASDPGVLEALCLKGP